MQKDRVNFIPTLTTAFADSARMMFREKGKDMLSVHTGLFLTAWRLDMDIPLGKLLENNTCSLWNGMRRWMDNCNGMNDSKTSMKEMNSSTKDLMKIVNLIEDDERKKEIFDVLIDFRRGEYALDLKLFKERVSNEEDIERESRLVLNGYVLCHMARVVNILNDVDCQTALSSEKAFYELGRAEQFVNDLSNFETDNGNSANLVVDRAKDFPIEYDFLVGCGFSKKNISLCKNTLNSLQRSIEETVSKIPASFTHIRSSGELMSDLVPLYSNFGINPR